MDKNVIFRETQQFRQIWLQLLVILYTIFISYGMVKQVLFDIPFGTRPMPDPVLIAFWIIFGIIFPIFMYSAKLITEVREDGLYIKFFPFHFSFHNIPLENIEKIEAKIYSPIREYGGWGIRYGLNGRAFNVSGNKGVELSFNNDKNLLIGSQKPEELAEAIKQIVT